MKRIGLIIAASLALPFSAFAGGGAGIGVAHGTSGLDFTRNDTTIFIPIALQGNLWIEPFLSYADVEVETSGGGSSDGDAITLGVGVFSDMHVTQHTRAYIGGRIGYVDSDFSVNAPGVGSTTGTSDGWSISPTIGFGYAPTANIIFGAEAFVSYNAIEDDANNEVDTLGTGTNLFARYFFTAE